MDRTLIARSFADFARSVASGDPTPGSGSVAAAVGALGAGLASMASRGKGGEGSAGSREIESLMEALLDCVDDDASVYAEFLRARRMGEELAGAVVRSIEVPLATAARALAVLESFVPRLPRVRSALASEADLAVQTLGVAVRGGVTAARANLAGLEDGARRAELQRELDRLLHRALVLVEASTGTGTGSAR